ncbi:MAG: hypothetical protein FWG54_02415 [Bacteroidetes bacterium]|nr:hypothetical protein [Bacteroidota bacterium]
MRNNETKVWSGFFTNLLGVILGIVLTFGGNALWQQREEKKKSKEMLILVRNELETNKEWFKSQETFISMDRYVYQRVLELKGNWKSIPQDTLEAYKTRTTILGVNQLTFSAWQILQNSEMIQKMTDKELVIRLMDCYFWINKMQEVIMKEYWDRKVKALPFETDLYKYFDVVMSNRESVSFYTVMSSHSFGFWNLFPTIDAIIDYTIMLLDKRGDYRYNMEEEDREMELFIQARIDSVYRNRP